MNANYRRVPTHFAPETRFEVIPIPAVPFRRVEETRFECLKNRLLLERIEESDNPQFNSQLRRAANEAAFLAWVTPYPVLVFPALFEEKAAAVLSASDRPAYTCQESKDLVVV